MTHRPSQPRTDTPRYLTEDRLAIRDLARDFAMTKVLPVANELDPVQGTIPDSLKKEMAEIGFFREGPLTLRMFAKHCPHPSCPVPAGILKAVEVEAGLALPKDASIRVMRSGE